VLGFLSRQELLEAKRAGHIRNIRAELDKLLETSFFLSPQLYDQVLRIAGEHAV
jgi:predicted nucleic acid-binding protein